MVLDISSNIFTISDKLSSLDSTGRYIRSISTDNLGISPTNKFIAVPPLSAKYLAIVT